MPPVGPNYSDPWMQLDALGQQRLLNGDLSPLLNPDANSSAFEPAEPNASMFQGGSELGSSFDPSQLASLLQQNQASDATAQATPPSYDGSGGGSVSVGYSSGSKGGGVSDAAYKKILDQINATGTKGLDAQRAGLGDMQDRIDSLKNRKLGTDLSGLMTLGDFLNNGKTNLAGSYKRPLTEDERQAMLDKLTGELQKQKGSLSADEIKLLTSQLHGQYLLDAAHEKAGATAGKGASDQEEKDAAAFMKAMDTEKSSGRFTPIGKAQSNLLAAERVQGLLNQYQKDPGSMPLKGPSSLSEVAIGLNTLLSAQGGSEESRKSLIPESARGKFSTLESFIMNRPEGAEMEEFVKNAQDTLNRERQINAGQVGNYLKKTGDAYGLGRFAKQHPERYKALVDLYLNAPSLKSAAALGDQGGSSTGPHGPSVTQNGHTYNWNAATGKYE